jgi:hypothetical protein
MTLNDVVTCTLFHEEAPVGADRHCRRPTGTSAAAAAAAAAAVAIALLQRRLLLPPTPLQLFLPLPAGLATPRE